MTLRHPFLGVLRRAGKCIAIGCLLLGQTSLAEGSEGSVQVVDDRGRTVTLDQPANRIAALMPHAVQMLHQLGATKRIAGTLAYPDRPDELADKPVLGDYYSINVEAVLRQSPDLIIAWPSANIAVQIEQLESLGIPLYYSEPQSMSAIGETYIELGQLTGRSEQAEDLVRKWNDGLDELRETYQQREPVRIFYQIWNDPLFTVSEQNFIGQILTICGGDNIYASEKPLAPQVSRESVLQRDPQAIVGAGSASELTHWKAYATLTAVRKDLLFVVDDTSLARPTTEVLTGARQLCQVIDQARKTLYTGQ